MLRRWWIWFQRASTQGAQSPAINKSGPGDVVVQYGITSEQVDELSARIATKLNAYAEIKAMVDASMTVLSERADRQRLAVPWIIYMMAAVFVDEMRMLY